MLSLLRICSTNTPTDQITNRPLLFYSFLYFTTSLAAPALLLFRAAIKDDAGRHGRTSDSRALPNTKYFPWNIVDDDASRLRRVACCCCVRLVPHCRIVCRVCRYLLHRDTRPTASETAAAAAAAVSGRRGADFDENIATRRAASYQWPTSQNFSLRGVSLQPTTFSFLVARRVYFRAALHTANTQFEVNTRQFRSSFRARVVRK